MRFYRALASGPVEVVCGLVLIALGIYITSIGSAATSHRTGLLTAGGVMTAFGGVLISWIASRAYTRDQAREEFGLQLGSLSRSLGQAAGQIGRAVDQAVTREIHPATGFALISQANRMIYGQVNEIAVIQGAGFDPAYLLETATKLDDLAVQLESRDRGDEGLESVRRELANVRTNLTRGQAQRTYSVSEVVCPSCNASNRIALGDIPGDTATGNCAACGRRYNAHRAASGLAFSRPWGQSGSHGGSGMADSQPEQPPLKIKCPECGEELSVRRSGTPSNIVCIGCNTGLIVDTVNERVFVGPKYSRIKVPVAGRTGARPQLACPTCGTLRNALLNTGTSYLAICREDLQLMEASYEDWEHWRREQDGQDGNEEPALQTPLS